MGLGRRSKWVTLNVGLEKSGTREENKRVAFYDLRTDAFMAYRDRCTYQSHDFAI